MKKKKKKILIRYTLLEPDNEEAMYMLIDIKLKKSDYAKVKDLSKNLNLK